MESCIEIKRCGIEVKLKTVKAPGNPAMLALSHIIEILGCQVHYGTHLLNRTASCLIASDRMSYVLSSALTGSILITALTSPQVIRTAYVTDLIAVIFVKGEKPAGRTVELGKESDIPLLSTDLTLDETLDKLSRAGISVSDH